ncbi:hypothetical protein WA158_001961 [Blastocystis sp. Blastoise]
MNTLTNTARTLCNPSFTRALASAAPESWYLLFYKYVPGILEKRGPFRPGHLANAKSSHAEGKCQMVGAYANPPDGACFAFKCKSKDEIHEFVKRDPYYQNGLVTSYEIRDWCVVPLE